MREYEDQFRKKGATLAAIGLGDFQYATFFREKTHIIFRFWWMKTAKPIAHWS